MSKAFRLIIIVSVALLLLLSVIILISRGFKDSAPGNPTGTEPVQTGDLVNSIPVQALRLEIQGRAVSVETNNFLKDIFLNYNGYVEFFRGPDFIFGFDGQTQQFTLNLQALNQAEYNVARQTAEAKFLELLGVSENDACKLKVEVRNFLPNSDPEVNYKISPLSFCENV